MGKKLGRQENRGAGAAKTPSFRTSRNSLQPKNSPSLGSQRDLRSDIYHPTISQWSQYLGESLENPPSAGVVVWRIRAFPSLRVSQLARIGYQVIETLFYLLTQLYPCSRG